MIDYICKPEDYFNHVGISVSGLNLIDKSPAHYQASLQGYKKQSAAFLLGSAVHCAVLEPDEFPKRYVLADYDRRTKEGKAKHAEMLDRGLEGLTAEMYTQVIGMQKSVLSHPLAKILFSNGNAEVSCFHNEDGVHTKARADYLKDDSIVDLKTTQDASPREFLKSVMNFKYYRQAAWYLNKFNHYGPIDSFYFVAVEKEPPYAVAVYQLEDALIERGDVECDRLFRIYKNCLEMEDWPSYPEEIMTLTL